MYETYRWNVMVLFMWPAQSCIRLELEALSPDESDKG
jgi:hypothetical protein